MDTNVQLPYKAVYFKKILKWGLCGKKSFDIYPYDVIVISETEKSYKIKFQGAYFGRQTFVRKDSVKFNFLENGNYCRKMSRHLPDSACSICRKDCALSGRDFPKAVIINT